MLISGHFKLATGANQKSQSGPLGEYLMDCHGRIEPLSGPQWLSEWDQGQEGAWSCCRVLPQWSRVAVSPDLVAQTPWWGSQGEACCL